MCIVKSWQHEFSARIDHLRIRSPPRIHFSDRTHSHDAISQDGDRLRPRLGFVHGVNIGIGDNQIGRGPRLGRQVTNQRHN